jgi:hypothetical protein
VRRRVPGDPDGTVDFDAVYDHLLRGRGTSTAYAIRLDLETLGRR